MNAEISPSRPDRTGIRKVKEAVRLIAVLSLAAIGASCVRQVTVPIHSRVPIPSSERELRVAIALEVERIRDAPELSVLDALSPAIRVALRAPSGTLLNDGSSIRQFAPILADMVEGQSSAGSLQQLCIDGVAYSESVAVASRLGASFVDAASGAQKARSRACHAWLARRVTSRPVDGTTLSDEVMNDLGSAATQLGEIRLEYLVSAWQALVQPTPLRLRAASYFAARDGDLPSAQRFQERLEALGARISPYHQSEARDRVAWARVWLQSDASSQGGEATLNAAFGAMVFARMDRVEVLVARSAVPPEKDLRAAVLGAEVALRRLCPFSMGRYRDDCERRALASDALAPSLAKFDVAIAAGRGRTDAAIGRWLFMAGVRGLPTAPYASPSATTPWLASAVPMREAIRSIETSPPLAALALAIDAVRFRMEKQGGPADALLGRAEALLRATGEKDDHRDSVRDALLATAVYLDGYGPAAQFVARVPRGGSGLNLAMVLAQDAQAAPEWVVSALSNPPVWEQPARVASAKRSLAALRVARDASRSTLADSLVLFKDAADLDTSDSWGRYVDQVSVAGILLRLGRTEDATKVLAALSPLPEGSPHTDEAKSLRVWVDELRLLRTETGGARVRLARDIAARARREPINTAAAEQEVYRSAVLLEILTDALAVCAKKPVCEADLRASIADCETRREAARSALPAKKRRLAEKGIVSVGTASAEIHFPVGGLPRIHPWILARYVILP